MKNSPLNHESICIVTGAAGGMGHQLALQLLQKGCHVVATDIDLQKLTDTAQALPTDLQQRYHPQQLDVSNADACQVVIEATAEKYGQLDIIINNAGIMSSCAFEDSDISVWKKVVDINLMGVSYCSYNAYKYMRKQGYGKIVNVASTAGITPTLNSTAYAASKHGVVGLTRSLRGEAKAFNIDVQMVVPGLIDTQIFDSALDDERISSSAMADNTPIKKYPADKAAKDIINGIEKNHAEIIFPFYNRAIVFFYRLFPRLMTHLILGNQKHQ